LIRSAPSFYSFFATFKGNFVSQEQRNVMAKFRSLFGRSETCFRETLLRVTAERLAVTGISFFVTVKQE